MMMMMIMMMMVVTMMMMVMVMVMMISDDAAAAADDSYDEDNDDEDNDDEDYDDEDNDDDDDIPRGCLLGVCWRSLPGGGFLISDSWDFSGPGVVFLYPDCRSSSSTQTAGHNVSNIKDLEL